MADDYRIVCIEKEHLSKHAHIVVAGTGDKARATHRWTVEEVRSTIGAGGRFYTVSPSTAAESDVERYDCTCGVKTIRSSADAVTDNNLDQLRECRWKQR